MERGWFWGWLEGSCVIRGRFEVTEMVGEVGWFGVLTEVGGGGWKTEKGE